MKRAHAWFLLCCGMASVAAAAEPVSELRHRLSQPYPSAAARGNQLADSVRQSYSILDLSELLVLAEWRDDDPDEEIARIDRSVRDALLRRFEEAAQEVLVTRAPSEKIALANLIARTGTRLCDADSCRHLGRSLGTSLAALTADPDILAGEAACRALAAVQAPAPVFVSSIRREASSTDARRRSAAVAAGIERCADIARRTRPIRAGRGQPFQRHDLFEAIRDVTPILTQRLEDIDSSVRRVSMAGIVQVARTIEEELPAEPLAPERASLEAVRTLLATSVPELVRPCAEIDELVQRLQTVDALSQLDARIRPCLGNRGELHEALAAALRQIAPHLAHRDVRVRLGSSRILESMGPAAAPVVASLEAALVDSNGLVRWSVARTLGKMKALPTSTVLALADRLNDPEPSVRAASATSLGQLGSGAGAAAPALIAAANQPNPMEVRLAVLRALERTGVADLPLGQAVFARALADTDSAVREQAVAYFERAGRVNSAPGVLLQPHPAADIAQVRDLIAPKPAGPAAAHLDNTPSRRTTP